MLQESAEHNRGVHAGAARAVRRRGKDCMRGQFTFAAIAVALVLAADSGSGSGEASSGSEYSSGSGAVESGGSGVIEASSAWRVLLAAQQSGSGAIEPSSGSVEPPSPPASPVPPTPPPSPPNPPPPPTDTAIAIEAAQLAPPAFTLKPHRSAVRRFSSTAPRLSPPSAYQS